MTRGSCPEAGGVGMGGGSGGSGMEGRVRLLGINVYPFQINKYPGMECIGIGIDGIGI